VQDNCRDWSDRTPHLTPW